VLPIRIPTRGGVVQMPLFGKKCSRCGAARTSEEYEGLPTCESCKQLIKAKLQAAKEITCQCPIDSASMEKAIVLNIEIDHCPTCSGVWLDGGELELMNGTIEAGMTTELLSGMAYPF
jgi:hypothetical protein